MTIYSSFVAAAYDASSRLAAIDLRMLMKCLGYESAGDRVKFTMVGEVKITSKDLRSETLIG